MSTTSGSLAGGERGGSTNTLLFVLLGLLFVFAIVDFAWMYVKNSHGRYISGIAGTSCMKILSSSW